MNEQADRRQEQPDLLPEKSARHPFVIPRELWTKPAGTIAAGEPLDDFMTLTELAAELGANSGTVWRFTETRPARALYHPFFAAGVDGGELAANLYQEFAHLEEATDYARGLAEIALAAQRAG
jgi:hypothetical protein